MTEFDNLELYLPSYLKHDINAYLEGLENNSLVIDCLYCELQASINVAYYDNNLTEKEANYLREKYLGLIINDDRGEID